MDKFDYKSARLVGVVILICFIFIMVIWNAFQYLPDSKENSQIVSQVVVPGDDSVEQKEPQEKDVEVEEEQSESEQIQEDSESPNIEEESLRLEPVDNPETEDSQEVSQENRLNEVLNKAKSYKQERQYVKAISEYEKATSISEDVKEKANCYEEISVIYAGMKRYGTALAYAQKAYNLSPTTSREVLLARLYFKTGDIDKATRRINNVLQRDFTLDR